MCSVSQLHLTLCGPMDCSPQAPLSRDFPGKITGVGCYFLLQGGLPDPGIKPVSLVSPALGGRFFTTVPPGKPTKSHGSSHIQYMEPGYM